MARIISLQNIVLPAIQYDRTVAFYKYALLLEVMYETPEYCFLKVGEAVVAIHPADPESQFMPTGHGFYLDLLVEDLGEFVTHLQNMGVTIDQVFEDEDQRYVTLQDPEGNILELIEPKRAE